MREEGRHRSVGPQDLAAPAFVFLKTHLGSCCHWQVGVKSLFPLLSVSELPLLDGSRITVSKASGLVWSLLVQCVGEHV